MNVEFSYKELHKWRNKIRKKADRIDHLSFLDIDESKNRIVISSSSLKSDNNQIFALLDQLNIPERAIITEEQERININLESLPCIIDESTGEEICEGPGGPDIEIPPSSYTLRDEHSTYTGGIQIRGSRDNLCTLGLNVSWANNSRRGFVTASHCTEVFAELDYEYFYQGNTQLGREEFDRETWQSWNGDSYCNDSYECKYSDVALIEYPISLFPDAPVGTIARPASLNSIELNSTSDLEGYFVYDTITWPVGGIGVHKVGRTTGLTTGTIDKSCTDSFASRDGINYMYICVSRADYDSDAGDSGAPILTNSQVPNEHSVYDFEVMLAGFHIGGNSQNNYAVFSGPHYTTGVVQFGHTPTCQYVNGWLNSELCDEQAGFGPYEVRHTSYQN
jgi:hypothetical protein